MGKVGKNQRKRKVREQETATALTKYVEEKTEEEVDVPHEQAGLMFLLLWVAVEVLNENWTPAS